MDPNQLRSLVQDCIAKHLYSTAVFYADKLVTLTQYAPGDVYLVAQTYFVSRQHRRAVMLLKHHGLMEDVRFRYLAAKCLAEVEEWDECLTLLGDGELDDDLQDAVRQPGRASWLLSIADPFCQEAFAALVDNHMLTNSEELSLLDSLPFRPQDRWLALLYRAKCKKYLQHDSMDAQLQELQQQPSSSRDAMATEPTSMPADAALQDTTPQQQQQQAGMEPLVSPQAAAAAAAMPGVPGSPSGGYGLGSNADVLACRADWLFHLGRYEDAYQLTSSILSQDSYATQALSTHLAAALLLGKKNELFLRAHKLVEEYPNSALAWFGVGCYYMASRQYEQARRFFAKATQLDKHNAHAWIGFGHAFAEQDESDQALAAYRTAARLFPGLHTPLLGMGCAYQRMNNLHLCERCFLQAHEMCPHDPAVAHELGVLAYRNRQYEAAAGWLSRALELLPGGKVTRAWEATLANLAHVMRKQQRYTRALQLYQQALSLNPHNAGCHAGLAYTHQLMGSSGAAVEHYHKALALRPDDAFASEMLGLALQEECALFGAELDAAEQSGGFT
ncbi:hypothetical protein COO60DRAFT_1471149 [Scenedesmus sp. NREL 46B-D3]|nr:hypothetical protein COO60DRAFT_1471149 [Scenedesmus sp. NREL 46B-D3]